MPTAQNGDEPQPRVHRGLVGRDALVEPVAGEVARRREVGRLGGGRAHRAREARRPDEAGQHGRQPETDRGRLRHGCGLPGGSSAVESL